MKDLGPKNYVLFQLRGTIQSAKLWIRRQLNLSQTNTASPPPSDGRGTQVVEATGSEIKGAADGYRPGNLNRCDNVTNTRLKLKLAAGLASRCHSATTASLHRSLRAAGKATSGIQGRIKGKKFNRMLCGFNHTSCAPARKITTWNIGRPRFNTAENNYTTTSIGFTCSLLAAPKNCSTMPKFINLSAKVASSGALRNKDLKIIPPTLINN